MIVQLLYFFAAVLSLCGIYILWEFAWKPSLLDTYRSRLFEIRDYLFNLGASGKISFDDPAYRSIELLINGLIRYAHRLTFVSYIMTWRKKEYVDPAHGSIRFSERLGAQLEKASPEVRDEINKLHQMVSSAVFAYLVATSSVCKVGVVVAFLSSPFYPGNARRKKEKAVRLIENQAYNAGKRSLRAKYPVAA
jgi:hypothetical protein